VTLQPGCPLVVAPSFHLPVDWAQRLLLGAGVEREGEGFFPRVDWRSPDQHELGLLLPDPSRPLARQDLEGCLCLFRLPQHLCSACWDMVEKAQEAAMTGLDGFDAFAVEVARFLAFKELSVPEGAAFDLLVSKPGQRSIHRPGQPPGLRFSVAGTTSLPLSDEARRLRLWGGINLSDEPTSLVFVNLPARGLLAELGRRHPDALSIGTLDELAERFLTLCPDYPPVRLRIEPGEGFRLPAGGLLADGCTLDKNEPDLLLLVVGPS
jgi:hypothetical protein